MESFAPRPRLRDRVVSIERVVSDGHTSQILPSTGAVLGLQVAGRIVGPDGPLSALGVTGIADGVRAYSYHGPTETFLVRFQPQGAACLGLPGAHLSGRSQSLDELWSASRRTRAQELQQAMLATTDTRLRVTLLEEFLLALPFRRDQRVERALWLLGPDGGSDGAGRVAVVAREVGLSERQLERLFLERIGVSPKRYARLCRFERASRLTRDGHVLSEVAFASGYADQAHFIREFRRFTGTTPGRFGQARDFVG